MDLGPMEIFLIVLAVVLLFGVGKLGDVGGALGKSIREFRRERDGIDEFPRQGKPDVNRKEDNRTEVKS